MSPSPKTLVVCGGGLAGNFAALMLARSLAADVKIIQIAGSGSPADDRFYGSATAPGSYNFLHALGLDERTLLLESQTSFSYGTLFKHWSSPRPWMLCHHAPFPVLSGIPLRHFLTRSGEPLETVLISARAAARGRFAHPPENPRNPLSRAEYGYQFAPDEWTALLDQRVADSRVERIRGDITGVHYDGHTISAVQLAGGASLSGDLFVDASGPARQCIGALAPHYQASRPITAIIDREDVPQLGPPCRVIESCPTGWTSVTHLQDSQLTVHIGSASEGGPSDGSTRIVLGQLEDAWVGNCIAVGHAAWAVEPLTPAPMMLLQRDMERLQDLIPASADMSPERREFNRRFRDDVSQIKMFHDALYLPDAGADPAPGSETSAVADGLARKMVQFRNRGVLVNYDLEPFNEEDWTQNHLGMGRTPRQHDRQLDSIPLPQAQQTIAQMKHAIEQLVSQMPPHHVYLEHFKAYLEKQSHD